MKKKKETTVDYFVVIPAFLSMLVMLNYYFSYFVLSRILCGLDIDTFSLLSIEDALFPMAPTNEATFLSMFLLIGSLLVLSYHIKQVYIQKRKQVRGILNKYINPFFLKRWYLILAVFIFVIAFLGYLSNGVYLIILLLAVLVFRFSDIFSLRNCAILFGVFVCSLHLFYDLILRNSAQKEYKSLSSIVIETQNNRIFKTDAHLQIVFWGAKYVILKRLDSHQVELIPTNEIKHTIIRRTE